MLIFCLQKQRAVKIEGFPSVFTAFFIDIFIKKRGGMATYTLVDKETCITCGACGAAAPEIFNYDEEGLAEAFADYNKGTDAIREELEEELANAQEGCPTE